MAYIGYIIAGVALLGLAEVAPDFSVATMGVVVLGALLSKPQNLSNLSKFFTGGGASNTTTTGTS